MIWLENLKTKLHWLDSYFNAKSDMCFLQVNLNINPLNTLSSFWAHDYEGAVQSLITKWEILFLLNQNDITLKINNFKLEQSPQFKSSLLFYFKIDYIFFCWNLMVWFCQHILNLSIWSVIDQTGT